MTTRTISGTYNAGYKLQFPLTSLSITGAGYIRGRGIYSTIGATTAYAIVNDGRVESQSFGVFLARGGSITNGDAGHGGALIEGTFGVDIRGAAGAVTNGGTIVGTDVSGAGVYLGYGGIVTNGGPGAAGGAALIEGLYGVAITSREGTVENFGTIEGKGTFPRYSVGVYLAAGGTLTNGSATDPVGLVEGQVGVRIATPSGTVNNFGTILGAPDAGPFTVGIAFKAEGRVRNGSNRDTSALIQGAFDAVKFSGIGTVVNKGTLNVIGGFGGGAAVALFDGGHVRNGGKLDSQALIRGAFGVEGYDQTMVKNFGTIEASGFYTGVSLGAGSRITNGDATHAGAVIHGGYNGVAIGGGSSRLTNFGTIDAGIVGFSNSVGIVLADGGRITNGTAQQTGALIEGKIGVALHSAPGKIFNDGVISGDAAAGIGVSLAAGGTVTNGASEAAGALIEGHQGVVVAGAGTVINFGTIAGLDGGEAVVFQYPGSTLVVEAGSMFLGAVLGGGGTLDLASGKGEITALTGGDVAVSGAAPPTTFTNFGTVKIGRGARFRLSGAGATGDGGTTSLNIAGRLIVTGSLATAGPVAGGGTLAIRSGAVDLEAGTVLSVAHLRETGAATVTVATDLTYAGVWTQSAGTVSVSAGNTLSVSGMGNSFAGTLAGAGTVALAGGADALNGATLSAAHVSIAGAAVSLAGAITITGAVSAATSGLTIAADGATLTGGGTFALSDSAANKVVGANSAASLVNLDDKLQGAGQLGAGQMTLVNGAGGTINANGAQALIIDTGANAVTNAGLLEATAAGGLTIFGAVVNTGTLAAAGGNLTVQGAVTGAGVVRIAGATADFAGAFEEDVTFTGSTGVLELAQSQAYGGAVSGFSKTGGTQFDLDDIAFSGSTKATYTGNTKSGTLTVTDGTHTAHIKLKGDYTASAFVLASDGHGGTLIHDPARPGAFIAAMAGWGARDAGPVGHANEAWREARSALSAPRAAMA